MISFPLEKQHSETGVLAKQNARLIPAVGWQSVVDELR